MREKSSPLSGNPAPASPSSMLAAMGLLPWTAKVTADKMEFEGLDLLAMTASEAQDHRQGHCHDLPGAGGEPQSVLHVGFQLEEVLERHMGLKGRAARNRVDRTAGWSASKDGADRLGAYPHQMSGGQCQRVMIAMAIACNPKLLIADEPTTALDVTIQKQILDLLVRLQAEHGMGLIMITHDMGVVAETADRVIVQYKGHKMEEADVLSLFENPKSNYTRALLSALPENAVGERLPTVSDFVFEPAPGVH
jgi:dipeptide transport system ATP-binding protein